jgi:hypothetical protein
MKRSENELARSTSFVCGVQRRGRITRPLTARLVEWLGLSCHLRQGVKASHSAEQCTI